MTNDLIAIIPARSGSKGINNKNTKYLGGHPLLAYSIAVAKLSNIKKIIVSTDSNVYAEIVKLYGAEVPFIRPDNLSTDLSPDYDFMVHAMEWAKNNIKPIPEYWIHLRPTTPLRNPEVIKSALSYIKKNPEATSLRSGHEVQESPFKWFLKDKKGFFKGLRDDLTPEKVNLPRQIFPKMYNPDGYIDIVRFSHVSKNKNLHGNKMLLFESPVCTEVDRIDDFQYLEYEINKKSSVLKDWLDRKVN